MLCFTCRMELRTNAKCREFPPTPPMRTAGVQMVPQSSASTTERPPQSGRTTEASQTPVLTTSEEPPSQQKWARWSRTKAWFSQPRIPAWNQQDDKVLWVGCSCPGSHRPSLYYILKAVNTGPWLPVTHPDYRLAWETQSCSVLHVPASGCCSSHAKAHRCALE